MKKIIMQNFSDLILTKDNKPTTALKDILNYYGINPNQPLHALIAHTQKQWLRPALSERWHLQETKTADQKKHLLELFKKVGLIQQFDPIKKEYDYILFMGGDLPGMQERLTYMFNICQKGTIAHNIIFLTAQRALDPEHESSEKIYDVLRSSRASILCESRDTNKNFSIRPSGLTRSERVNFLTNASHVIKTEYELLRFLYKHAQLPASLSLIEPTYINTPNLIRNSRLCRATTPDTIIEWLKEKPTPGSCLVISSQPLIGYQNSVTHSLLAKEFTIESVGPEASTEVSTDEYLDTLARWLYQEGILRKIIN